jgi:hypothetical protein
VKSVDLFVAHMGEGQVQILTEAEANSLLFNRDAVDLNL